MASPGLHPHQLPPEFINRPAAYLNHLFESGGHGTIILLAQCSIWELETIIKIAVNEAELATYGHPTDPALHAQLHTVAESEPAAITFYDTHHVRLSNLTIDGRRPDKGWIENGGALVQCGGRGGKDPVIQYCVLRHPRVAADPDVNQSLQVFNHCDSCLVVGNHVGPAGLPAPDGPWADGLSIACRNGIVANNEIVDATDGAIVLFCTPGTLCVGNTIIARTRNLLGAINMVDAGPFEMDYTNTRVFGNIIKSEGAHIKLGIGIGPLAWAPGQQEINFGGVVHDNLFGPGRMGYAIGVAGAKNFSILGNRVVAGTEFTGNMSAMPEPLNAPPMAFLAASQPGLVHECKLQPEFVRGRACWLIGLEDGPSKKLRFDAGHINLVSYADRSDGASRIVLDRATLQLQPDGLLKVVCNSSCKTLWSSGLAGASTGARLTLSPEGQLSVREEGSHRLIWDPTAYLDGKVEMGSASLTVSDQEPYLVLWTGSNCVAWASEYVFEKGGLELKAGQFICMPGTQPTPTITAPPPIPSRHIPSPLGGIVNQLAHKFHPSSPPPIPPRPCSTQVPPTFLYLDPETSNLVLHQGATPTQPHGNVLWASELFGRFPRQVKSREQPGCETRCCFQGGDGNLVVYGNPFDDKPGERTALWASGTECHWLRFDHHHRSLDDKRPALSFHTPLMDMVKKFP